MTITESRVRPPEGLSRYLVTQERRARAKRLSLWRDTLHGLAVLTTVGGIGFFLASGAMMWTVPSDALSSLGRFTGLVATTLILVQMTLASRAPWVERAIGHDRAAAIHGQLGEPVFYLLIAHAALITLGYGAPTGRDFAEQTMYFLSHTQDLAIAFLSLGLLLIVGVTSVAAIRRRWPYETWHAIHLFTYAAVALSIPHQFSAGSTFRGNPWAEAYWIALYVVALGSLVIWRFAMPLVRAMRHRLVVSHVGRHDDGTVSVIMTGRNLADWDVRPGQFLHWRFMTRDLWLTAHPYSVSRAPDGETLRITVKPLGDGSAAVRGVRPGTRVFAAGPYGRFTHEARVARGVVLVAAGVGITPIRALLEHPEAAEGPCHVVVRARSYREVPLLDEVRQLAAEQGASLHEIVGPRGYGWSAVGGPVSLAEIIPGLSECDVFVCGPRAWSESVIADAQRAGVPAGAIHSEEFAW